MAAASVAHGISIDVRTESSSSALHMPNRLSPASGGEDCLEVADGVPSFVPVRDSKVMGGPVLVIGAPAWSEFVRNLVE